MKPEPTPGDGGVTIGAPKPVLTPEAMVVVEVEVEVDVEVEVVVDVDVDVELSFSRFASSGTNVRMMPNSYSA